MQPETVETIINWLSLLTLIAAIIGSILIIGTAVYQSLKARTVRWDVLGFIVVLLWSLPYGIRNYGPELTDASIDLINSMATKREPLEGAIRNLFGDTVQGGEIVHPAPQPAATAVSTPEPPAPTVTPEIDFWATTDAYMTAQPTQPPTVQPTQPPVIQPTPTRCTVTINGTAVPCPPTPQPGG